jgi:hypothetical protein
MGRGRPHKCPYCAATRTVAKGFRYNKTGIVKLRRCKVCKRRWTTGLAEDKTPDQETVCTEINQCAEECKIRRIESETNDQLHATGDTGLPSSDDKTQIPDGERSH